tara:strand:+ start:1174 stop:1344 length:171 start_codon:yes stop_codon:yes gene_type:complete
MSPSIKNRRKKHCFDGWEHYSYSAGKWMCGRQVTIKKNGVRGIRYIKKTKKSRRLD